MKGETGRNCYKAVSYIGVYIIHYIGNFQPFSQRSCSSGKQHYIIFLFYKVKEINVSSSLGQVFFLLLMRAACLRACACVIQLFYIYFFITIYILFRNLLTFRYI